MANSTRIPRQVGGRDRTEARNDNTTYFSGFIQAMTGKGFEGTPPFISAVSNGTPGATSATITWTTDVGSDSQVFWGLTTSYAGATSPIIDSAVVTSHSVAITGLITATTYHYKVRSRNVATQGWTESADATFITA